MVKKEFLRLRLTQIIPYENNPRINDEAVKDVMESVEQCGELDPIEIDENNVILSGHTRLKGKHKYLYQMTKDMRKRVEILSEEYPKSEINETK